MNSRIKFALKASGLSIIPLGVAVITLSEASEIGWRLSTVFAYAIFWVGIPAYFIRLFYEFLVAFRSRKEKSSLSKSQELTEDSENFQ